MKWSIAAKAALVLTCAVAGLAAGPTEAQATSLGTCETCVQEGPLFCPFVVEYYCVFLCDGTGEGFCTYDLERCPLGTKITCFDDQ